MIRTLHDWRWPYAAMRASVWLLLSLVFAVDPCRRGPNVSPATAPHAPRYLVRGDDVVLTMTADGTTFVASNWSRDATDLLPWMRTHNPSSRAVLRADRRARFGDVRRLLASARDAGYRRITIDAGEPEPRLRQRLAAGWAVQFDASRVVEPEPDGLSFSLTAWD